MCSCYRKTEKKNDFAFALKLSVCCVVQNSLLLALYVWLQLCWYLFSDRFGRVLVCFCWFHKCVHSASLYTCCLCVYARIYIHLFICVLCCDVNIFCLNTWTCANRCLHEWMFWMSSSMSLYMVFCMCMLTLTSVKFDSQSRTRWCLSTLILKMTVLVYSRMGERTSERTSEWASNRIEWMNKRAREKWRMTNTTTNALCSDERVNNPLNCIQHKRVLTAQQNTSMLTHTHTRTSSVWDMPILNSDFVTCTNMKNASEPAKEWVSARARSLTHSLASYSCLIFLLPPSSPRFPSRIACHAIAVCHSRIFCSLSISRSLACFLVKRKCSNSFTHKTEQNKNISHLLRRVRSLCMYVCGCVRGNFVYSTSNALHVFAHFLFE